ncbi:unnamed protein product [Urochloa humidicola]
MAYEHDRSSYISGNQDGGSYNKITIDNNDGGYKINTKTNKYGDGGSGGNKSNTNDRYKDAQPDHHRRGGDYNSSTDEHGRGYENDTNGDGGSSGGYNTSNAVGTYNDWPLGLTYHNRDTSDSGNSGGHNTMSKIGSYNGWHEGLTYGNRNDKSSADDIYITTQTNNDGRVSGDYHKSSSGDYEYDDGYKNTQTNHRGNALETSDDGSGYTNTWNRQLITRVVKHTRSYYSSCILSLLGC